jgi:hypothetical protein
MKNTIKNNHTSIDKKNSLMKLVGIMTIKGRSRQIKAFYQWKYSATTNRNKILRIAAPKLVELIPKANNENSEPNQQIILSGSGTGRKIMTQGIRPKS